MILEDFILEFTARVKKWAESKKDKYFDTEQEITAEHAKNLSYHAVFGVFPEDIISKAAPNETEEEFRYRKQNYKQKTKPAWDKALTFVYRIWNKQNYRVEVGEEYEDYFTDNYPKYENYLSFFRDVVTKKKLSDPNAVVSVRPYDIPTELIETEEGVFEQVDQTAEISPVACLFTSKDVFYFMEGGVAVVLRPEKTKVKFNGKDVNEGMWFEIYDKVGIYHLKQVGKKTDYIFDFEEYYIHDYGVLPVWRLGGIPTYDEGVSYYHSYFSGALPNLDEAVFLSSTLFASIVKHGFPTKWYYEDSCQDCNGSGYVMDYDGSDEGIKKACAGCSGTGHRTTFSWGKDYVIQLPENSADASRFDVGGLPTPPFGTVSPDTSVLEFLDNKTNDLIETAFANLNIDITNKPNGQTATESKIDREEAFSFLLQFSAELFELLGKTMNAIIWMRWMSEDWVKITAPNEFTIRSSDALTKEFSEATEANLPAPYLTKLLTESVAQRFNNKGQERLVEVVAKVDTLLTKTEVQIGAMLNTGSIQKWQAVLHANIFRYIEEFMAINEDWLDQRIYPDLANALQERAQQDVITQLNPQDTLGNLII